MKLQFSLLICLTLSCGKKSENVSEAFQINVDLGDVQSIRYSDIFKNPTFITFDPQFNISNIENALLYNDYIVIRCTGRVNSLFTYNKTSKETVKIAYEGKGPGEYIVVSDFKVNNDNHTLWLLDGESGKFLMYDLAGMFVSEYHNSVLMYAKAFSFINNNVVAVYYGTNLAGLKNYKILIFDVDEGKVLKQCLKFPEHYSHYMNFIESSNFTSSGLFHSKYDNNIYQLKKDDISILYQISFGKNNLPQEILDIKFSNVREFVEYCRKTNYAFGISNIIELNNQFYFTFEYQDRIYNCIYNLENDASLIFNEYMNDMYGLNTLEETEYYENVPVGGHNKFLIFAVDPLNVKLQLEEFKNVMGNEEWTKFYFENKSIIDRYDSMDFRANTFLSILELD